MADYTVSILDDKGTGLVDRDLRDLDSDTLCELRDESQDPDMYRLVTEVLDARWRCAAGRSESVDASTVRQAGSDAAVAYTLR